MVEGKTFTASPSNTVGVKLSELKEGDKVRVDTADTTADERAVQRHLAQERSSRASIRQQCAVYFSRPRCGE